MLLILLSLSQFLAAFVRHDITNQTERNINYVGGAAGLAVFMDNAPSRREIWEGESQFQV